MAQSTFGTVIAYSIYLLSLFLFCTHTNNSSIIVKKQVQKSYFVRAAVLISKLSSTVAGIAQAAVLISKFSSTVTGIAQAAILISKFNSTVTGKLTAGYFEAQNSLQA